MENKLLDAKRVKFGVYESALACVLFILYNFIFLRLYQLLPIATRQNELVSIVASFLLEATFGVAALTVALTRKVDFVKSNGMNKKINGRTIWLGFWISVVCLIGFSRITNLFLVMLEALGYSPILSDLAIDTVWKYLGYVLASCVAPAVCEELLFRGTIMSGFKQYGAKIAIIVSAVIFTFMHGNAEQTVHQFIIGVLIGYIFWKTGNLWLGVIIHFFNNFIAVTSSFIMSFASETETVAETTTLSGVSLLIEIVTTIAFAYFGWVLLKMLFEKLFAENEKLNGKAQDNVMSQVILVDGKESEVEVAIDGENQPTEVVETTEEQPKKEQFSVGTIAMFSIAGIYLALEWLAALLIGFGVG